MRDAVPGRCVDIYGYFKQLANNTINKILLNEMTTYEEEDESSDDSSSDFLIVEVMPSIKIPWTRQSSD